MKTEKYYKIDTGELIEATPSKVKTCICKMHCSSGMSIKNRHGKCSNLCKRVFDIHYVKQNNLGLFKNVNTNEIVEVEELSYAFWCKIHDSASKSGNTKGFVVKSTTDSTKRYWCSVVEFWLEFVKYEETKVEKYRSNKTGKAIDVIIIDTPQTCKCKIKCVQGRSYTIKTSILAYTENRICENTFNKLFTKKNPTLVYKFTENQLCKVEKMTRKMYNTVTCDEITTIGDDVYLITFENWKTTYATKQQLENSFEFMHSLEDEVKLNNAKTDEYFNPKRFATLSNFENALSSLKKGDKVRRQKWAHSSYLTLTEHGLILTINNSADNLYRPSYDELIAEDWLTIQ